MTIIAIFSVALLSITIWTRSSAKYTPQSVGSVEVCAVGEALNLSESLEEMRTGSCVLLSVRCAFACQRNAPNSTCFNYYAPRELCVQHELVYLNESCEFFGGSVVDVNYQQGCALWAVCWEREVYFCNAKYKIHEHMHNKTCKQFPEQEIIPSKLDTYTSNFSKTKF